MSLAEENTCTFTDSAIDTMDTQPASVHYHFCNCNDIAYEWERIFQVIDPETAASVPNIGPHPQKVDEEMWKRCYNFKHLLIVKKECEDRADDFRKFASAISRWVRFRSQTVANIVAYMALSPNDRTQEFEDKLNSLCSTAVKYDVEPDLRYYHESNHWSPHCYACDVEHDTKAREGICKCVLCTDTESVTTSGAEESEDEEQEDLGEVGGGCSPVSDDPPLSPRAPQNHCSGAGLSQVSSSENCP